MDDLRNLKGMDAYKSISITNDYTLNERLLIKEFHEKTKRKNASEEDSNYIWRTKGSPKNGLSIIRIRKANFQNPTSQPQQH